MDHFKSLGLEPSFYLDPEDVQAAFHKLSSSLHPDHFHEASDSEKLAAHQHYTDLNVAAQTLKDPAR
jgi:molecular chaperone HscB